jgi:hypothetical protein
MTIHGRVEELLALVPDFTVEDGADCDLGDLDPTTLALQIGTRLGLGRETLDLDRTLDEIIGRPSIDDSHASRSGRARAPSVSIGDVSLWLEPDSSLFLDSSLWVLLSLGSHAGLGGEAIEPALKG